jgi:hypothetical protein
MAVTDHGFFSLIKADRISPLFDLNLKEFNLIPTECSAVR